MDNSNLQMGGRGGGSDGTGTTLAAVGITSSINAGISLKVMMDLGIVLINQGIISGSTILVQEDLVSLI